MNKFEYLKNLDIMDFANLFICEMQEEDLVDEDGNVWADLTYWHTWDGFNFESFQDAYEYVIDWLYSDNLIAVH